jgi:hypothetical protein
MFGVLVVKGKVNVLKNMINLIIENYFGMELMLLWLLLFLNLDFVLCHIQVEELAKEFILLLKMAKVVDMVS